MSAKDPFMFSDRTLPALHVCSETGSGRLPHRGEQPVWVIFDGSRASLTSPVHPRLLPNWCAATNRRYVPG